MAIQGCKAIAICFRDGILTELRHLDLQRSSSLSIVHVDNLLFAEGIHTIGKSLPTLQSHNLCGIDFSRFTSCISSLYRMSYDKPWLEILL